MIINAVSIRIIKMKLWCHVSNATPIKFMSWFGCGKNIKLLKITPHELEHTSNYMSQ